MLLDFTNPVLDPRITFSRGTNATLVDSTGKITYAPANLLQYSQEFENAAWTKTNATITANTEIAPDGTMTADTFTATAANGVIRNDPAKVGTFINSIYVKRKTGSGAVQILDAAGSYTAVTVTSEWTRVSAAALATGASLFGVRLVVSGDEIYIWGAQAEQVTYQTTPGPYVATTASAYYGPRFDYDPVTLAPRGLLIEEARTNVLRYSEQIDNADWTKVGATISTNATAAPDGTTNADNFRLNAGVAVTTASGGLFTAALSAYFSEASAGALTAAAHTASIYVKAASGLSHIQLRVSLSVTLNPSVTNGLITVRLADGVITDNPSGLGSVQNAGNGWWRITLPFTATAAVHYVGCWVWNSSSIASATGTEGYFIWGAQLEAGTFATSYIPTVASTVSRSADVATMTGTNFSTWYNQSEGTFVVDVAAAGGLRTGGGVQGIFSVNDGTTSNVMNAARTALRTARFNGTGSPAGDVTSVGTMADGGIVKLAAAYKLNDWGLSLGGATVVADTSAVVPPVNRLGIGSLDGLFDPAAQWGGHIRAIAYYNTRLPNTQLQTLTAPSLASPLVLDFISPTYTVGY
jgi:hypothetical protein